MNIQKPQININLSNLKQLPLATIKRVIQALKNFISIYWQLLKFRQYHTYSPPDTLYLTWPKIPDTDIEIIDYNDSAIPLHDYITEYRITPQSIDNQAHDSVTMEYLGGCISYNANGQPYYDVARIKESIADFEGYIYHLGKGDLPYAIIDKIRRIASAFVYIIGWGNLKSHFSRAEFNKLMRLCNADYATCEKQIFKIKNNSINGTLSGRAKYGTNGEKSNFVSASMADLRAYNLENRLGAMA